MLFSENNFTDLSHDVPDTSKVAADGIPGPIFGKKHTLSHYFSQNQNQTLIFIVVSVSSHVCLYVPKN